MQAMFDQSYMTLVINEKKFESNFVENLRFIYLWNTYKVERNSISTFTVQPSAVCLTKADSRKAINVLIFMVLEMFSLQ